VHSTHALRKKWGYRILCSTVAFYIHFLNDFCFQWMLFSGDASCTWRFKWMPSRVAFYMCVSHPKATTHANTHTSGLRSRPTLEQRQLTTSIASSAFHWVTRIRIHSPASRQETLPVNLDGRLAGQLVSRQVGVMRGVDEVVRHRLVHVIAEIELAGRHDGIVVAH